MHVPVINKQRKTTFSQRLDLQISTRTGNSGSAAVYFVSGEITGKEQGKETGLYYVYHYAGNNPVKLTDPDGRTDVDQETFKNMSAYEQLDYLRQQVALGYSLEGKARGDIAKHLRDLRGSMRLYALFLLLGMNARKFMNTTLRDFMNLNTDGTDNYDINELTPENGWKEESSFFSMMHQTEVSGNKLNAKFTNKDGREVVMDYKGNVVKNYPDKGTYNFVNSPNPDHWLFDIRPYNEFMSERGIRIQTRFTTVWFGNSTTWGR